MQEKKKKKREMPPMVGGLVIGVVVIVGVWIVWSIAEKAPQQQKDVFGGVEQTPGEGFGFTRTPTGGVVSDIKKTAPVVVGELPTVPVVKVPKEEGRAEMLVLTPQQLAQANEMLAAFEGKPLNELVQVYGVMQMAAVSVSPNDRPVFEFVLAKLGVYIAGLER